MQEMLYPTSYLKSKGWAKSCALITDGRFSGGSAGLSMCHISPEAAEGGQSVCWKKATASRSTSRRARCAWRYRMTNWPSDATVWTRAVAVHGSRGATVSCHRPSKRMLR